MPGFPREYAGVNMKRRIVLSLVALGALISASGCVSIPSRSYNLVSDIAQDQQSLNDAYGRALNGQILLNVLRSRDRWPRHYTNVSPITDQPTIETSGTTKLSPLGLGNAEAPLVGSELSLSHNESTRPSYGVQPLDSEAINRAVLSRTERTVFSNYWDGGWPRDVVLFVMVGEMRPLHPGAAAAAIDTSATSPDWGAAVRNTVEGLDGSCHRAELGATSTGAPIVWDGSVPNGADPDQTDSQHPKPGLQARSECQYFQLAHLLANVNRDDIRIRANADPVCQDSNDIALAEGNARTLSSLAAVTGVAGNKLSVYLPPAETAAERRARLRRDPHSHAPPMNHVTLRSCNAVEHPAVMLEVLRPQTHPVEERDVVATYLLDVRSLDSMVYAMGEALRGEDDHHHAFNGDVGILRGPCAAGTQNCPLVPMFRVAPGPIENVSDYASVVVHRGVHYYAGPAVQSFHVGSRREDGDRTATVLTLLTQLFSLNNSPGTLLPIPARPVID